MVWLVEMFGVVWPEAFLHQVIRGAWGLEIYDFYHFPMGKEWLKRNIMNMIKVESLNKNIRGKAILKDISFEVAEGECVALLTGPKWCR